MAEFNNPYIEPREKAPGELAQEYAALFKMASLFFGVSLTDREQAAVPVLIGAFLRERKKIDIQKLLALIERFSPDA